MVVILNMEGEEAVGVMENALVIIFIAILITSCFGAGYWLVLRPIRRVQATTTQMETLLKATQIALAQAQEETRALRRALTAPTIQGQQGD